jgi:hypothetical protein
MTISCIYQCVGPPAVPFFGNIFQLINAFKTYTFPFTYLAKTYGEIYRLKVPMDEIGRFY